MTLAIIIPCYNESESLSVFYEALSQVVLELPLDVTYCFVDDGSTDGTLEQIQALAKVDDKIRYLSFSRNFGKEAAIAAGLSAVDSDYVALMDADLQDPPSLLIDMYNKLTQDGYDSVVARRINRQGEPWLRSVCSDMFYWVINRVSDTAIAPGTRDFRMMTRQVKEAVMTLSEYNRFSKGLFAWVGFKTAYVDYVNNPRLKGKTSWSFWALVKYGLEGIINFSEVPLNIATYVGILSVFLSLVGAAFIIAKTLIFGDPTSGWPSLAVIILFCSGINLLMLGIVGKYISKLFLETKKRPLYIVKSRSEGE